jgi:hypothetical protein
MTAPHALQPAATHPALEALAAELYAADAALAEASNDGTVPAQAAAAVADIAWRALGVCSVTVHERDAARTRLHELCAATKPSTLVSSSSPAALGEGFHG